MLKEVMVVSHRGIVVSIMIRSAGLGSLELKSSCASYSMALGNLT